MPGLAAGAAAGFAAGAFFLSSIFFFFSLSLGALSPIVVLSDRINAFET